MRDVSLYGCEKDGTVHRKHEYLFPINFPLWKNLCTRRDVHALELLRTRTMVDG